MTSDDVVPSLKRWMQQGQYGRALATVTADVKATGKYAIELKLKQKYAAVEVCLAAANNFAAIYPKEIAERFPPAEKVTEFVGTGPYKLAEWKPDQYIRMVRFDDYKSLPGKANGYGGAKTVWVDEIRWIPVPDVATRVAQMETGELEFADDLNIDAFDRLQKSANARPVVAKPYYWLVAVLNKKEGLMTNQKLRQAWQAAIDIEPIMKAVAGGRSEFYRMGESGLAFVENTPWYVKPNPAWGWNERNKDKAKKLMQEAGYKGEPVRFVTTQEYKWMYDFALVTKQQLEDVGFNIDLQVVDWATLVKRRNNPKEYEAFTTGTGNIFEPTAYTVLSCTWPGWTCDADIQGLLQEMAKETDPKKRFALWEQMHKLWYEKVPSIRYGDLHGLRAASKKLQGFNEKTERPRFYNVWLDR
jgi:peptide/nickel transport system substrate-binding protein